MSSPTSNSTPIPSDTTSLNAVITYLYSELSARDATITDLTTAHEEEMSDLMADHQEELSDLKIDHEEELSDLKTNLAHEVLNLKDYLEIEVTGLKDTVSDLMRSRALLEEISDSQSREMSDMTGGQKSLYEKIDRQMNELEARDETIEQQKEELKIRADSIEHMKAFHTAEIERVIAKKGEIYLQDEIKIEKLQEELQVRESTITKQQRELLIRADSIEAMKAAHAAETERVIAKGGEIYVKYQMRIEELQKELAKEQYAVYKITNWGNELTNRFHKMEVNHDYFVLDLKDDHEKQIAASNDENTKLKKKLCARSDQLTCLQTLHERIVAKLKDERAQDASASYHRTKALETQVLRLRDDLKLKDVAIDSLHQRHSVAKEALSSALADLENIKVEKEELQDDYSVLGLAYGDVALKVENLCANVEQKHADFMNQREEFEEGSMASAREHERLEEMLRQSAEAARDQREIVSALVGENEELQDQLDSLQEKLAERNGAHESLEQGSAKELRCEKREKAVAELAASASEEKRCAEEQESREQLRILEERLEGAERELDRLRGAGDDIGLPELEDRQQEGTEAEEESVDLDSEHSFVGLSTLEDQEYDGASVGLLDSDYESPWEDLQDDSEDDDWN